LRDVRVNFGGLDISVTEQLLQCADVSAGLQQVGREAMPEVMRFDPLLDPCFPYRFPQRLGVELVVQMVPTPYPRFRIDRKVPRRKNPKLLPSFARLWHLPRERFR